MATAMDIESVTTTTFSLNNGYSMPAVGLGTYRIRCDDVIMKVVDEALAAGYRLFDTAAVYHNEVKLKKAFQTLLPKYGLEREEIFVTTKLCTSNHGGIDVVRKAYEQSLENLGLDYVDLYLIHFPGTAKLATYDKKNTELRNTTWASLVELYDLGLVNAIGVSNFTVQHLKQLIKNNHGVIPAVNQVEWHPFYYQNELLSFCKENDIVLQAYSSLGGTSVNNDKLLKHPAVTKIAKELEVSNSQVLLGWALQQDVAVIPKSVNPDHIKQNISLNFTIPNEYMRTLNNLGSYKIKYAWDPSVIV